MAALGEVLPLALHRHVPAGEGIEENFPKSADMGFDARIGADNPIGEIGGQCQGKRNAVGSLKYCSGSSFKNSERTFWAFRMKMTTRILHCLAEHDCGGRLRWRSCIVEAWPRAYQ
jgi:hypothetical protein